MDGVSEPPSFCIAYRLINNTDFPFVFPRVPACVWCARGGQARRRFRAQQRVGARAAAEFLFFLGVATELNHALNAI